MLAFLTVRLRTWLLLAVAVPVATVLVHLIRVRLERRSGRTRLVRALTRIENLGRQQGRGPLAKRA